VLEKNHRVGGSTGMSVGSFSAGGTRIQASHGVKDTPEEFLADMISANGDLEKHDNPELRKVLAFEAGNTFNWALSLGLQFFGPTPEPPFRNPRMHNIVPSSRAYIVALSAAARRAGVVITCDTPVEGLLTDGSGRVHGVVSKGVRYTATRGVVLATGDYSANRALRSEFVSPESAVLPSVNPTATGDGFVMAMELGAATRNMWRALEGLRLAPPRRPDLIKRLPAGRIASLGMRMAVEQMPRWLLAWFAQLAMTTWVEPSSDLVRFGAVLINSAGERFAHTGESPTRSVARLADNTCYLVFDSVIAQTFSRWPYPLSTFPGIAYAYIQDYERFRPDVTKRAANLAELAHRIGADPEKLSVNIAAATKAGSDDELDLRDPARRDGRTWRPPYYSLGPLHGIVTLTDGGLAIDAQCRVLRENGTPILGLYAVGSTGQGGLILRNHGLHIAWALTSGRRVGRVLAEQRHIEP